MTAPLFLDRTALGKFLGIPPDTAIRLLKRYGCVPIDLGRGRGLGLRWRTSRVMEIADALHAEAQKTPAKEYVEDRPLHRSFDKLCMELRSRG